MRVAHLTSSTLYGGPERQMLGLAGALPAHVSSAFVSFSEGGRCRPFLDVARSLGFEAHELAHDTPHLLAACRELTALLHDLQADLVCCNGYKANLLGRRATRRLGVPAVAVSRGWTGESLRVRLYEALDRWHLRRMDRVVCVSEAQAVQVRRAGVAAQQMRVIANAVDPERFTSGDFTDRLNLETLFNQRPQLIVGAAGRLSPEKGFEVLAEAAAPVCKARPGVGFVLFGEGPCRGRIERQIELDGLGSSFVLAGFRSDLDRFLPHFDLLVLPSYTEGLPNIVLEACAAGVPVVATAVGGTPEALAQGAGQLVPPGDPAALSAAIAEVLDDPTRRRALAERGRKHVLERYTFGAQARCYEALFHELCPGKLPVPSGLVPLETRCEA